MTHQASISTPSSEIVSWEVLLLVKSPFLAFQIVHDRYNLESSSCPLDSTYFTKLEWESL